MDFKKPRVYRKSYVIRTRKFSDGCLKPKACRIMLRDQD